MMKNHLFTKLAIILTLALCSPHVWGYERTFDGTERVFFKNVKPTNWDDNWICDGRTGWIHFWRSGYSNVSDVKLTLISGTEGAENAIYVCTPAAGTYTDVTIVRSSTSEEMTWSEKSKDISVGNDASLNYINNLSPSDWEDNYGHWAKYAPTPAVVGSMNNWKAEVNPATSSRTNEYSQKIQIISMDLAASTNYTFLVIDGEIQYGQTSLTITGSTKDGSWEAYSTGDGKTVTLTTDEAGTYYFQYNTVSQYVAVYYPKSQIAKNKVLYFDARNSTEGSWTGDYHAKYVYKYYDSGNNLSSGAEQFGETKLEDGVFYTVVPNVDHVGQVQICSVESNDHGSQKAYSNNGMSTDRSSSKQNCLMIKKENASWKDTWVPGWQTYCPPKATSTISDNGTVKYTIDGLEDGSSSHPWLVEKNTTIKVSAASTNYVEDGNMTTKYNFYDNTTSKSGEQSGTTYQFTASSSPNVTYQMRVNAYNQYNSTNSSDKYSDSKYYKTVTCYTVTYFGNGSGSGSVPAVSGTKYAATANVTVAGNTGSLGRPNYTFDGWNTDEHIVGTAYAASSTISSISGNVGLYAKWNQNVTLDDNSGKGDGSASVTMTYNASTHTSITNPTRDGYTFAGWYEATDGDALVINTAGVLQPSTSYTDASGYWTRSGAAPTLHAHWTPVATLTFKATTNSNWSTATNWTPNCVPTIDHDVVIEKPVIVDVTSARAKSVVLDQSSTNTGKLTISAGQELVIAGILRKTTDGSSYGATAAEDVVINSDASNGLGALVMGSHEEVSGLNQATVYFYSKSGKNASEKWVNQYIGTPFGNEPTAVSQFYNSWLYKIKLEDTGEDIGWFEVDPYEGLISFKGYNLISNSSVGRTYEMQGSLVASIDKNCLLYHSPGTGPTNPNNETLLANSWMAPIKIAAFAAGDFTGAEATIYIFNAGSLADYNKEPAPVPTGDGAGQYSTYPIGTAGDAVIPAMQSFSVFTSDGSHTEGSLFLDYSKLVYDPAVAGTNPEPNRSPKRAKAETSEREEMLLCVRGANGPADRVRILAHEDFNKGFENGWDGHKIFGESFTPQLYAMTTDGNMAVNCVPEYEGTVLGFKPSDVDNSYTFYFRYDGDETLYLNDLKAEQSTLIQDENTYPFTSSVEDAEARFVISATPIPHTPTGIQSVQSDGEQGAKVRKLFINGAIYIIRSGRMYDVLGKTMRNEK